MTWRHFKLGLASDEELGLHPTPLSGVFSIEKASADRKGLQQAVDRIVAIIQASPDKERIDNIITRWLKRYLQRLGAKANLDQLIADIEELPVEEIEKLRADIKH